jgi:hypothetical protein
VADKKGLYLYVSSGGAKSWRYDYRIDGRRATLVIGLYPDIPLAGDNGLGSASKPRASLWPRE